MKYATLVVGNPRVSALVFTSTLRERRRKEALPSEMAGVETEGIIYSSRLQSATRAAKMGRQDIQCNKARNGTRPNTLRKLESLVLAGRRGKTSRLDLQMRTRKESLIQRPVRGVAEIEHVREENHKVMN